MGAFNYLCIMRRLVLLLFFVSGFHLLQAQLNYNFQAGTFLIKGRISDLKSGTGIGRANVTTVNRTKGVTADNEGVFNMYVLPSDTLRFSAAGFLPKFLAVSDLDSSGYYTIKIELIKDFIQLKEFTVYPFSTKEEFEKAFLEAKEVNKLVIPGIKQPEYSNKIPRPKLTNPVSLLYDKMRKKRKLVDPYAE